MNMEISNALAELLVKISWDVCAGVSVSGIEGCMIEIDATVAQ
jgi:hypothetical protein